MASAKENVLTWRVIFDEAGTGAHINAQPDAAAFRVTRPEVVLRVRVALQHSSRRSALRAS